MYTGQVDLVPRKAISHIEHVQRFTTIRRLEATQQLKINTKISIGHSCSDKTPKHTTKVKISYLVSGERFMRPNNVHVPSMQSRHSAYKSCVMTCLWKTHNSSVPKTRFHTLWMTINQHPVNGHNTTPSLHVVLSTPLHSYNHGYSSRTSKTPGNHNPSYTPSHIQPYILAQKIK